TTAQTQAASPYRWTIAAVLLPLQFSMGLNFFGPAALFPLIMDDFQISRGTVSLLVVAVTLAQVLLLIPGGILAARLGSRKAITLAGLLISLGVLGGFGPSFPLLVGLRVCFGIGASILLPATSTVVVQWFRAKELPYVNGVNMGVPGLGVGTAMFIGVPLASALGWEGVFFVYGAFTLLATLAWGVLARSSPMEGPAHGSLTIKELLGVVRERNTLLLSLASIAPLALFVGYSSWLPTYYNEVFGMSLQRASALVTIIPLLGAIVNASSGLLLDRAGIRKPFLVVPCIILPVAAIGTFATNNQAVIIPAIMLLGMASSIFMPALFTVAMELPGITPQRVALVISTVLTLGNLGAAISPWAVGASTDRLGSYLPSLFALALLPLLTVVAGSLLPETGPKAAARRDRQHTPAPVG
ncbi:MAG: putative integral rane protein, partial [Dehalococcoidia bacterium]|nr:putative integral rane protein [Dehalococcoidia bacterium]